MTPQIQMLMHPFKHHGIFKDTMTKDLQVLRKNQDIILAALTVFVSEPTMVSWFSKQEFHYTPEAFKM